MRQGWIYVMVNASMRGMVKVGRTTREPRVRVAELSAATGVPTPFRLAFDQTFRDCERAEREIHTILDERGLRVRANREFFHGPARNIVRVIVRHAEREPAEAPWSFAAPPDGAGGTRRDVSHDDIACDFARRGDPENCFRAWEMFFARHAAPPDRLGLERYLEACRTYIACCLSFGLEPRHRGVLLPVADAMLEQQAADPVHLRGTKQADRVLAVRLWIYRNLDPDEAACNETRPARMRTSPATGRPGEHIAA